MRTSSDFWKDMITSSVKSHRSLELFINDLFNLENKDCGPANTLALAYSGFPLTFPPKRKF